MLSHTTEKPGILDRPVDRLVLGYAVLTGLYILAGISRVENAWIHLLLRVLLVAMILVALRRKMPGPGSILNIIRELYPLALLGFFYHETYYLNNILFPHQDAFFCRLEQDLFGIQPSLAFSEHLSRPWFSELMYLGYFSYFVIIAAYMLYLFFSRSGHLAYSVFMVTGSFFLYYLVFCLLPVAGPQFYFHPPLSDVPPGYLFSKLVKWIQYMAERPTGGFPSSHAGVAMIMLTLMYRQHRKFFFISVTFVSLLMFSAVYIKAHYLVDVIAGVLSFPVVFYSVNALYTSLETGLKTRVKKEEAVNILK